MNQELIVLAIISWNTFGEKKGSIELMNTSVKDTINTRQTLIKSGSNPNLPLFAGPRCKKSKLCTKRCVTLLGYDVALQS